jgi:hypothetical protein
MEIVELANDLIKRLKLGCKTPTEFKLTVTKNTLEMESNLNSRLITILLMTFFTSHFEKMYGMLNEDFTIVFNNKTDEYKVLYKDFNILDFDIKEVIKNEDLLFLEKRLDDKEFVMQILSEKIKDTSRLELIEKFY